MSAPASAPASGSSTPLPSIRHAQTAVDKQRAQLEKLLKDPSKAAHIPPPPKEKTLRPAREMMKNVQGSSAGAGSGEFHVYKASRRREYERLQMMKDETAEEAAIAEFEQRKAEREQAAEAKTAKNRAKRDKKKAARKKGSEKDEEKTTNEGDAPLKKRKLVSGAELVFKKPGEGSDEEDGPSLPRPTVDNGEDEHSVAISDAPIVSEEARILIHED